MRHITFVILAFISTSATSKEITQISPDGNLVVTVTDENQQLSYKINYKNTPVIASSKLGFSFAKQADIGNNAEIKSHQKSTYKSQWQLPWGERTNVTDHHNLLKINVTDNNQNANITVTFKVFNEGVGFRYTLPSQVNFNIIDIVDEHTEFVLADENTTAWWIPARGWNRYEYTYKRTPANQANHVHTPVTFKTSTGIHVSIHEAALIDYAAMTLKQQRPFTFKADLTPWYDGTLVKKQQQFTTPWRTIQIASNAAGLINSDIILNLNEPNKLGDVSWVEPGKYVGIWWGMHINENTWGSGDKHGATTSETKRYIDFAAKHGFSGVLVEGWNIGWDGSWFDNGDIFSFTKSYDDFNLPEISAYGHEKGVRLIGHHETSGSVTNYRNQMSAAYDLYAKHHVRQIKTGYVADGGDIKRVDEHGITRLEWHDSQFMVNEYLHSVVEAAKRKISINTHEPIKDTGLRRTYPNWITREGARGQEFNAWGTPPNPPEHTTILPFTRMLSGPMDFTPGIFNLSFNGLGAKSNRPQTTLAKQLALYVVLYSPIQMAADLPRNYEAKPKPFQFIKDVPTNWQESLALEGEIGDFVIIARQDKNSDDWYIGGLTDENARTSKVDLSFLNKNKQYEAQIYRDGEQANWIDNPYDIIIEKQIVTAQSILTIPMATSGGFAVRLKAL